MLCHKNENLSLGVTAALSAILIANYSFASGKPTCSRYVANVYLHIILGLAIIGISSCQASPQTALYILGNEQRGWSKVLRIVLIVAVLVACMFFILLIPNENWIFQYALWVPILIILGIVFYPLLYVAKSTKVFYPSLLVTLLLFGTLSLVAFSNPNLISMQFFSLTMLALFIVIVFELISIGMELKIKKFHKMVSMLVIFIFSVFVLYDTGRMLKKAENCVKPNYLFESLHFILDFLNLLARIISLRTK